MKPLNIILIVVGVLILIGVIVLVARSNKQARIKAAGKSAGLPDVVAQTIAESADPEAAARSIGVPAVVATAIASGVTVNPAFLISGLTKLGTGTFNSCPKGTQQRVETGGTDQNGNKLYDCYGTTTVSA